MEADQRAPMTWDATKPTETESSRLWDDDLRTLKTDLAGYFQSMMQNYPTSVASKLGCLRVGYVGAKADLPRGWPSSTYCYVRETDHLYGLSAAGVWVSLYPPGGGDPRDALRLLPGRGMQADAYMYAPGDVIADDLVRPDYAPLPGYRALAVGRGWIGDILYTARACFTFDLSTAPTAEVKQVFFDIDVMEYGAAIGGWLDILPGGPGPTPLAFHHALDPALAIVGDEKFRLVTPPFTTVPAAMGWDITPHYLAALPAGGMILRIRAGDETTVPPKTQLWLYGLASAEVAGREPRLTIVSA
jgi:hypothetical protein